MTSETTSPGPDDAVPKLRPPPLRSLVRYRMTDCDIHSVAALQRELARYDAPVSIMQLHRIIKGTAKNVGIDVLGALAAVLHCQIGELFEVGTGASTPIAKGDAS